MILGIGSDITDVRRIAKVIERHGERFLDRVFTATERAKADKRRNRVETYAKRFAAKEACAKALGTGLRAGVWWRDMGVINLPSGRPTLQLTGGAKRRLDAITPAGYEARIDLTITDEGPMAHAFVIISAIAVPEPLKRCAAPAGECRSFLPQLPAMKITSSCRRPGGKLMAFLAKPDLSQPAAKSRVQLRGCAPRATKSRGGLPQRNHRR